MAMSEVARTPDGLPLSQADGFWNRLDLLPRSLYWGTHLACLLALWTGWWRDVLLAQAGCLDACNNIDHQAEIERDAQSFVPVDVQAFLHTLSRIEGYLHHTVNTTLALDVLLLQLPRPTVSR